MFWRTGPGSREKRADVRLKSSTRRRTLGKSWIFKKVTSDPPSPSSFTKVTARQGGYGAAGRCQMSEEKVGEGEIVGRLCQVPFNWGAVSQRRPTIPSA